LIYEFFQTTGLFLAKKAIPNDSRDGTIDGDLLRKIVEPRFIPEGAFRANAYDEAPADEAGQDLGDTLFDRYVLRRKEWGEEIAGQIERQIALQTIDQNWTKHIDTMSRLREGIYLRSYANTNPLQDYVNEGHALFREMLDKVSADACLKLLNVVVQIKKPEEQPIDENKIIDAPSAPTEEKE
jgi:preprotein translocase subunit SecA